MPSFPQKLFDIARFLTDFADQAVILPLIAGVAAVLLLSGWRRGALVWCLGTCATLGTMLLLKMSVMACGLTLFGTIDVSSPSGHTAAAGAVYGCIFAFVNSRLSRREAVRWLTVLFVVVVIGASRVVIGAHTVPEAVIGAMVGFAAANIMLRLAGEPTDKGQAFSFAFLPLLLLPLLLHGTHLQAEDAIREISTNIWPWSACRAAH